MLNIIRWRGPFTKQRTKETEYHVCTRLWDLVIAKEMRKELRDSVSKAQGLHKICFIWKKWMLQNTNNAWRTLLRPGYSFCWWLLSWDGFHSIPPNPEFCCRCSSFQKAILLTLICRVKLLTYNGILPFRYKYMKEHTFQIK